MSEKMRAEFDAWTMEYGFDDDEHMWEAWQASRVAPEGCQRHGGNQAASSCSWRDLAGRCRGCHATTFATDHPSIARYASMKENLALFS